MKRHGGLYPRVCAFENVWVAARRAQRGKRYRDDVLAFNYHLERNLLELCEALTAQSYRPGPYKTFVIYEPKRRLISAAPYRDRVVHHALCSVIEPLFDAGFIDSCYANRRGKGTHKALDHFVGCMRRYRYCLRADIEKYFPSMDHDVLKARIRRTIKCRDTLRLIDLIVDNSNAQEPVVQFYPGDDLASAGLRRKGLPIGNLTSQIFANVYLSGVDHAMTARYGARRYMRYVDDFAVFSDSPGELVEAREALADLLAPLRAALHPAKTQIAEAKQGVSFLGFRVFPDRIRLRQENVQRARRRMRRLQWAYRHGWADWETVRNSLQSWNAHAAYGDTWRLRERVFGALAFARS